MIFVSNPGENKTVMKDAQIKTDSHLLIFIRSSLLLDLESSVPPTDIMQAAQFLDLLSSYSSISIPFGQVLL